MIRRWSGKRKSYDVGKIQKKHEEWKLNAIRSRRKYPRDHFEDVYQLDKMEIYMQIGCGKGVVDQNIAQSEFLEKNFIGAFTLATFTAISTAIFFH